MIHFGDKRLPARFWAKVQPEPMSGCWLFVGAQTKDGYGSIWIGKTNAPTHRLLFSVENEIPQGLVVDHKCRVRCCVNPAHLRAITFKENVLIGIGPSALCARMTTCKRGHEFAGENLQRTTCRNERICRACRRASRASYNARERAKRSLTTRIS